MTSKKRICIVIGSRANYSSAKSVMQAVADHPDLELQLVVGASALLDRYGTVVDLIERDGFSPVARSPHADRGRDAGDHGEVDGPRSHRARRIFEQLKPDVVLTVGDRFETMATTLAAAYMNIPIAHTMGGEVSGTIDESIRHAVTKFAHIHFPASRDAHERILRLGERPEHVHLVGCPRIDLVADILAADKDTLGADIFAEGVGAQFDLDEPFVLVSQHPVTTEYGEGEDQITATLEAVAPSELPAIVLWPNADAGSEDVARGIRKWREHGRDGRMHFFKNLPIDVYVRLMRRTACLVGNSSSGIREGAFIGTPVVNIGSRQAGRERGHNVIDVPNDRDAIAEALERQISNGRYAMDPIYGDGNAAERIADILAREKVDVQKRITY